MHTNEEDFMLKRIKGLLHLISIEQMELRAEKRAKRFEAFLDRLIDGARRWITEREASK